MIGRGDRPIHAAVRFEALKLRVAFQRWKVEHASLAVFVLSRLQHVDFALDERASEREAWSPRFDAPELARSPPGPGLEIVHGDVPGVPRPLGLDRRHGTGGQAKLGCERGFSDLDRTHG